MKIGILPRLRRCTMTASLVFSTLAASIAQPNTNDPSFNAGTGFSSGFATGIPCEITRIVQQSDGKLLVGGSFTSYNGTPKRSFVRLNNDGSIDATFKDGSGFAKPSGGNVKIMDILVLPNSQIMVSGNFETYDGIPCNDVVRLNSDGTLDQTFNYDPGMGWLLRLQADGKVVTGRIRINTDGTLDPSYNPDPIMGNILPLLNGKFIGVGVLNNKVFRLNNDGKLDNTFSVPGQGFDDVVTRIVIQPDGKYIVSGGFAEFNGVARKKFARLNPDGTLDPSFNMVSSSTVNTPEVITLQADGKLLVGSRFALYRLNTDGTLDQSFQTPTIMGNNGEIFDICIQKDGKIVIGGDFAQAGTATATGIARFMGAATNVKDSGKDNDLFSLFPNPASKQVSIQYKGHAFPAASFTIYDVAGKAILHWTDAVTDNYQKTIDVLNLPQGQYILRTSADKLVDQRFTVLHTP